MKTINFLFIVFLVFISNMNLHAQNKKSLHIGPHLQLKNAFLTYSSNNTHVRRSELSSSFGISLYFTLSPKVELRSGLRFTRMNIKQVDYSYLANCDFNGFDLDYTNSYYVNHNRITYIGVPVNTNIKLLGVDNHLYLTLGMEFLAKIDNNGYSTIVACGNAPINSTRIELDYANRFVFKLNGGIGGEIKVSEKMKIFFEPQFEYSFGNVMSNRSGQINLANDIQAVEVGMMVGLKF